MKLQTFKYGMNTGIAIALVLGAVVLVEAISFRHHKRFDLTGTNRYTLSDQSKKILKSLASNIKVTAFFNETQAAEAQLFKDLLEQYKYNSPKFSYEFVDPDKNPGKAKRYKIDSYGTTIVESGDKEEKIFETGEENVTHAILKVTRERKKVIYFLKGHGEKSIDDVKEKGYSFARKEIENSNYEAKDIFLANSESVPEDADLLVLAGPQKPILSTELETLKKYIRKGGKAFFMIDPDTATEMVGFLEEFGVSLKNDIVVDSVSRIFGVDPSMPVVTQYGKHPIVKDFSYATFFPLARSMSMTVNPVKNIQVTPLIRTSPSSWSESDFNLASGGEAFFDKEKDYQGPVSIGLVVSINKKKEDGPKKFKHAFDPKEDESEKDLKEGRIIVIGDSDFASNSRITVLGNKDFFLNTINWLLEEEDLISIRPNKSGGEIFTLSDTQKRLIFWIPLVLMPGLFILSGIVVYRKRKNLK